MGILAGNLYDSITRSVSGPLMVVAVNSGRIMVASDDVEEILQRRSNEIVGMHIRDILPVEIPPSHNNTISVSGSLWRDGKWIERVALETPCGERSIQITWRTVPLGWTKYWLVTLENTTTNYPGFFFSSPEFVTTIPSQLTQLDIPHASLDNWNLVSFHQKNGNLGGDLLFIDEPGPDHILYFLGDVSGHHRGGLLVRGMFTTYLKLYRDDFRPDSPEIFPGELLTRLNQALAEDIHNDCLLTGMAILMEKKSGLAWYASAGHLPLFIVGNGGTRRSLRAPDIPLGIRPRKKYRSTKLEFSPGDRLLCYTDGLIAAANSDDSRSGLDIILSTLEKISRTGKIEPGEKIRSLYAGIKLPATSSNDITFSIISTLEPS